MSDEPNIQREHASREAMDRSETLRRRAATAAASTVMPGMLMVRVIRSVTVKDSEDHFDAWIDIAVPVGVPLVAGASILVTEHDIVTPIAHSFYDHSKGVVVVTTQAVTYDADFGLVAARHLYAEWGWHEVTKVETQEVGGGQVQ